MQLVYYTSHAANEKSLSNIKKNFAHIFLLTFLCKQINVIHSQTQPFYGSLDFVPDNLAELVPEDTFTHSHLLWTSIMPYLLPPSTMIHGIHSVEFMCLTVFFKQSLSKFSLVYLLAWHHPGCKARGLNREDATDRNRWR